MDWRRLYLILGLNLLLGAGVLLYLQVTGYWSAQNEALRTLLAQGVPATSEQVAIAVQQNDLETLRLLEAAQVDLNANAARGPRLNYPLHVCALRQDWQALDMLLELGADPLLTNGQGLTVASILIDQGDLPQARQILQRSKSTTLRHHSGEPYLIHAIAQQQQDVVALLLEHGISPETQNLEGHSALYLALQQRNIPAARALLQHGATATATTPEGVPLLHHLCQHLPTFGFPPPEAQGLIRDLVQHGATSDYKDTRWWRAIQWLVQHDQLAAGAAIIAQNPDLRDTLWIALQQQRHDTVVELLELGADPTEISAGTQHSPLHYAIHHNEAALVTALLDNGASPEELGREGQSALITALTLQHSDCALALLRHPQRPAAHSSIMQFPISAEFRALYGTRGLFDWHCSNVPGITPLMVAVMQGLFEPAKQLIANGASRSQPTQSRSKIYPIQLAAKKKDIPMQQLIMGAPYADDQQVRKFVIDLSEQKVYYYREGELVKTSRVSTGSRSHPTEPGMYIITDKIKHKRSNIYNNAKMPYFQRFSCSAIGFHEGNTSSGYASHGCIRLPMSTAKYFWGETSLGDRVEIRP